MPTSMPNDINNHSIPVLRLRPGASQSVAVTSTSARTATPFNTETRVVSLYATTAMFVRFGDSTVTAAATDHYLPADTYMDVAVGAGRTQTFTSIAAVRSASDGTLYVSEKY